MLPQSPAALALQAIKNFRQKEIRAPTIRVLKPYRAPIPKSISSPRSNDTQVKPHGQPNPFLPRFNTKTGRWAPPKYSLRQQAELIKKAKASNTLHLLPPGPKFAVSNVREKDAVVWEGEPKPKVLGAETGNRLYAGKKRMFKGHKRERTRGKREIRRNILLRNMKKRIIRYKGVSFALPFVLRFVLTGCWPVLPQETATPAQTSEGIQVSEVTVLVNTCVQKPAANVPSCHNFWDFAFFLI